MPEKKLLQFALGGMCVFNAMPMYKEPRLKLPSAIVVMAKTEKGQEGKRK